MIEFFKLLYERDKKEFAKRPSSFFTPFEEITSQLIRYRNTLKNPKFIEMLMDAFPNENILHHVKRALMSFPFIDPDESLEIISNVDLQHIIKQVKQLGKDAIVQLPRDLKNNNQIISAGIECDGFKSLSCLDVSKILQNKNLILKAYEKDGLDALAYYIKHTLDPLRDPYYRNFYDARYRAVQFALFRDPEINKLIREHLQKCKAEGRKPYTLAQAPTGLNKEGEKICEANASTNKPPRR